MNRNRIHGYLYILIGTTLWGVSSGFGVIAAIVLLQMAKEKASPSTPIEIHRKE